jgi:hypothetical protein
LVFSEKLLIVTQDPCFWTEHFDHEVMDRLGAAPDELVRYVALVNSAYGIACTPVAALAPPDLLFDVQCAMKGMPAVVISMLQHVLLGVYFARGLGSSAVTDVVVDENGNIIGSVVALDLDIVLSRRANEWATWKENTPFARAASMTLDVQIAEPEDDTRANALQFLLLHEFGHVLTAGKRFLPTWWLPPELMKSTSDYAFLELAWQISPDKKILPKAEEEFAGRSTVSYYAGGELDDSAMLALYQGLQETSFATLYASINAYDDFAETFATFVHSVLLGKPCRIRICCDGEVRLEAANYWSSSRSAPKRAFMAEMLSEQ